jgi:predicted nucleic acid-binding protein
VGLTVLDAGVIIAILDASDVHHDAASLAVSSARDRGDSFCLPASAYAECLVSPYRRGPEAVTIVDAFDALPARVEPVTRAVANAAAELRARHTGALRLPDALVIAAALVLGADRLITTDAGWPAIAIPVELLRPDG